MSITVGIIGSDDQARMDLVRALEPAPPDWVLQLHREPPSDVDVVVCDPGIDIPDAIVFEDRQQDLIALIAERTARCCRSIIVSSPSGGTGVTSVALHVASELVARGFGTALVDLCGDGGARARLGMDDGDPTFPVPVAGGFRLIDPLADRDLFDRVVIAAPRDSISEAGTIQAGILVCSPSPVGARRARSALDEHPSLFWTVAVNRLGPGGETTRSEIQRIVGMPIIELPCCAALRDAEDDSRLLRRGWTRWSRAIARLVDAVDGR